MLINLYEILTETGKNSEYRLNIEAESFDLKNDSYCYTGERAIDISFRNKGNKIVEIVYNIKANLLIPCDRCLELVKVPVEIQDCKELDLKKTCEDNTEIEKEDGNLFDYEKLSELDYLDGLNFDTEVFVKNEILIDLPMKVLCSEDCKGICRKCGTNLNKGSCDCNTIELDPRMSKILDVFNQFKEV